MTISIVNGVRQAFGSRARPELSMGRTTTRDAEQQLSIQFSGEDLSTTAKVVGSLPAGAVITGVTLVQVKSVFALGGTTPVINVGVSGSEGTNRVAQISKAQAEALGVYAITSAGTLALNTPLAAAATLVVALGGTTPTAQAGGTLELKVNYTLV